MPTRCRIGMINDDSTISSIYCSHDGYPSGVGRTLVTHWNDYYDIVELIASGNISSLEKDLETTEFYNNGSGPKRSNNITEYLAINPVFIEYNYLYTKDGWMLVSSANSIRNLHNVLK